MDLEWNVFIEDFNNRDIIKYNIFNHYYFLDYCIKAWDKFSDDLDEFAKEVRAQLQYYFWSKCEWEVIMTSWPPRDDFNEKKIDVAEQVILNWDVFIDYVVRKFSENDKNKT